jgi:multidrug resistance efflux pump
MRRGAIAAVVAAPCLLLGWRAGLQRNGAAQTLTFSGVVESREVRTGSRAGGRVQDVLVREGDVVQPGQLLVRLEAYDLADGRDEARARAREAEATLAKLREGPRPEEVTQARAAAGAALAELQRLQNGARPEEIERAQAELQAAAAELENASTAYGRYRTLAASGVISRQAFDDAAARVQRAEALRSAAQKTADLLLQGSRPEDIRAAERRYAEACAHQRLIEQGPRREDVAAAEAVLDQARATLRAAETRLSETEIRAVSRATVQVLSIRPGTLVAAGAPILTLLEPGQVFVTFYVPETALGLLRATDRLPVEIEALPGRTFTGEVTFVANKGEFTPRNIQSRDDREHYVFACRVHVEDAEGLLRPGMTARVQVTEPYR